MPPVWARSLTRAVTSYSTSIGLSELTWSTVATARKLVVGGSAAADHWRAGCVGGAELTSASTASSAAARARSVSAAP